MESDINIFQTIFVSSWKIDGPFYDYEIKKKKKNSMQRRR